MDPTLSVLYVPTAVALGALHAIEPGHAKTLTAAYLIGVKGTRRDAVLLGLSAALTHSCVVVALAVGALCLGREAFAEGVTWWLQAASGAVVVALGAWLLWRRWPRGAPAALSGERSSSSGAHGHRHANDDHCHDNGHETADDRAHDHDHDHGRSISDEDDHARAHAAALPAYVARGERPTAAQIVAFGAAGGLIPCPASVTVMLMAIAVGEAGVGLVMVLGFSLGLALTLVGVGLAVVAGLNRLRGSGRLTWFSERAPLISAAMVILSGVAALMFCALPGSH